jgi:translation initiation factor IF-1
MTLAQLLQGEPRSLVEVMTDVVANADAAMQDARMRLLEGDAVTVEQLDRLLELSRLAHHLSKTMAETGLLAKSLERQRATLAELGQLISEVLLAALDVVPLTPAWREYVLQVADVRLLEIAHRGTGIMEQPVGPTPELPPPPSGPVLRSLQSSPPIDSSGRTMDN